MFRDGQYLEVIKASDNCLATAVVTVQEKTIKIKEKKVSTNKWLDLEDWAALYKILEKAILRNFGTEGSLQDFKRNKWKKSTRQLEVTYMFEVPESVKDVTSLPTIRVYVSPAKRKSGKTELLKTVSEKEETRDRATEKTTVHTHQKDNGNTSPKKSENNDIMTKTSIDTKNDRTKRYLPIECLENDTLEEYVPDAPVTKKLCANLNYIPSRKSTLEQIQVFSNEYSPMVSDNKSITEVVRYVPNSMDLSKISYETYEPSTTALVNHPEEYVPNSKGMKTSVEEYYPDFTSKSMKFDNSYVPSSVHLTNENSKKLLDQHKKLQLKKYTLRQKETITKRNMDLYT
ncbi:PREDICTED: LOW QUALITY PROTEIN: uncharacterized protein LOC108577415 [Habropoda laboriosa]|uniref:LOW QUALITY PROTEIN: uncharacterized protein LOC108577415 n=1 Tax=Habropoda laboriosa TaxID=597456 RepID=UPI00083DF9F2|nr:PREDICTED: LOW QUALITY PROTEIN: uncharacterized protein LOC108577415 [Habropoda laboriosa]